MRSVEGVELPTPTSPPPARRPVSPSAPRPAIRVALYAEDPVTRAGLAEQVAIDRRTELVEPDSHPDAAVVTTRSITAQVMDTLRHISSEAACPVVMIVTEPWDGDLLMAVEFGVKAVLRRSDADRGRLVRALDTVTSGGADLPAALQGRLLAEVTRVQREILAPRGLSASGLSEREIDVLRLLSEGRDLQEIALSLSYSERTVKNILYTLLNRLGLRNRVHAVSYAMRAGLI